MAIINKTLLYWVAQIFGWSCYIGLTIILNLSNDDLTTEFYFTMLSVWIMGLGLSHLLRLLFIKLGWLELGIFKLLPRIIPTVILFGIALEWLYFLSQFLISTEPKELDIQQFAEETISWTFLFLMWSLFYFTYHFFQNYRNEEIKNLQLEASRAEMELNRLKSQLNPHFIFNSMNTIRALVDENPQKSKDNITKLSKILRSTLISGKKKLIPLEDELALVKDYLDLEHSRFEERLQLSYNIQPESLKANVPPMMLQTLVENCIKHGISKLPEGGEVSLLSKLTPNILHITIINSGKYEPSEKLDNDSTGLGINGTIKRLELQFGANAQFNIYNKENKVITELLIPQSHEN